MKAVTEKLFDEVKDPVATNLATRVATVCLFTVTHLTAIMHNLILLLRPRKHAVPNAFNKEKKLAKRSPLKQSLPYYTAGDNLTLMHPMAELRKQPL